ncbi:MAG TPA: ammonia channel protein, partial [Solimonas sp.]
ALLTGVFSSKAISGVEASMMVQAVGAFATLFYSAGMTIAILLLLRFTLGLRVNGDEEQAGLDLALHGERIV